MSGVERVLEIAASTRVLLERRLRALQDAPRGAVLGREFVTFRGLAERCAAETDVPVRALLGGTETTALAALCARGSLAEQVRERPGLAGALAATLRDLRDAGVTPEALPRSHSDLAATYRELERAFAKLENEGLFDRIGLFRLALRGAPKYLARRGFTRVEVHGATELVGSVGDLLEELSKSLSAPAFRFLQPDYQGDYAAALRAEWPWSFTPEAVEVVADPVLDPDGAVPAGALEVRSAPSPRAELEGVSRAVLALIEKGIAPSEIQIVARSLEPYAPWLEQTLGGYGIPFTSSLRVPEIAWPGRRAWLDLARALTRDLERAPVVRLVGTLGPDVAALAERIARKAAVVRGESDWQAALAETASSAPRTRQALERALGRLATVSGELARASDFTSVARRVSELGRELLGDEGAAGVRAPLESVARLDLLRSAAGAAGEVTRRDFERALEAALLEPSSTPFRDDAGGVRVLDAVQARGVPCRHLFLVGMVHGAWPRPVTEDPFLPDSLREELRSRLKRPVPASGRADREDRFLLGLLLSQARDGIVLSFHQSDSAGRALPPSALLRALPFVAPRTDVLATEVGSWDATPPAFARPAEALVAADPGESGAIAARLPSDGAADFRAGHELVACTDSQAGAELPYDGQVGPDALSLPGRLSPSTIEQLGQCPLRTLFDRILRARALDAPGADELEANEAGSFVHDALDAIYSTLDRSGALRAGTTPGAALERARAELPRALERAAGERRLRVRERHPTVWAAFTETVTRALEDFLRRDLDTLLPGGVQELATERDLEADVRVGEERLALRGTIDRIATLATGDVRVGDYKTSRQFDKPLAETRIRKGLALQIPLYARMVATRETDARVIGEALTVPLRPERDRDEDRNKERAREVDELESLSNPALAELASLLRRGIFPTTAHEDECRFCAYTVACRINHPPSRARIEGSEQARGYFALAKKS